jgi:PAS domain S-box-containing protein
MSGKAKDEWHREASRGSLTHAEEGRSSRGGENRPARTERSGRAEPSDREVAHVYRHLADAVPHLVWMARPDGTVFYYNNHVERYSGFERHRDGTWVWAAVLHPDDAERTAEVWQHALDEGTSYEVEHRVRMADGTYRWHVSRALPMVDEDGQVVRWYGTATDVHRMKEAEAALRENEERLRLAQRAANMGSWDIDLKTGGVTWSDGLFDLFGLPSEEGVPSAEAWTRRLHPDDRGRIDQQVAAAIEAGGPYENEFRVVLPDGEVVWLAAQGHVLHDTSGHPVRFLGVNYDVTFRKRTEAALRELNETLEERVNERTWEVREREGRIRELSRALTLAEQRERHRIAYVLHDDLQQILAAARFAANTNKPLLDDLLKEALDLTRSLSYELSPPLLEGEDIGDLIEWLAEQKRKQYGLEVAVDVGDGDLGAQEDLRVLLYQVVRELLFNVVKHAETKRVRIAAERMDDHIRVVVADEGVGFDPDALADAHRVGLGLPRVRERLELVGGRLEVDSAPGRGTWIAVLVPLMPE